MAEGCRQGLVTQAMLRASIIFVGINQVTSTRVPVLAGAAVVPSLQMFSHQSLVHVLCQNLIQVPLPPSWRPHSGIRVLGQFIRPLHSIVPVPTTPMVAVCWVRGVEVIVTLEFALVNVSSVRAGLIIKAGVTRHIVCMWSVVILLIGVTAGVLGDQIWHAARIAVDCRIAVGPVIVGMRVQRAVWRRD